MMVFLYSSDTLELHDRYDGDANLGLGKVASYEHLPSATGFMLDFKWIRKASPRFRKKRGVDISVGQHQWTMTMSYQIINFTQHIHPRPTSLASL